ncbi:MAG: DUF3455 domain-containing protein [Myxococcaceae bacterium]
MASTWSGSSRFLAVAAVVLLSGGCASAPPLVRPTVPSDIEAPSTVTPVLRWFAHGTQNYTCTARPNGAAAEWKLTAPEATLTSGAEAGAPAVGTHGAGPSWVATDGSRFVGNAAEAKRAPSPEPNAVAWLLVPKKEGDATGTLGGVQYVQRVDTHGGQPPATGCDAATVGTTLKVPYSATYLFYR